MWSWGAAQRECGTAGGGGGPQRLFPPVTPRNHPSSIHQGTVEKLPARMFLHFESRRIVREVGGNGVILQVDIISSAHLA